jgi:hypothetical protein
MVEKWERRLSKMRREGVSAPIVFARVRNLQKEVELGDFLQLGLCKECASDCKQERWKNGCFWHVCA